MNPILKEEEMKFSKSIEEITDLLKSSEDYIYTEGENDSLIKIKNSIENSIYNNVNLIQYKNIYFGGVTKDDPSIRDGYGINFYYDENNKISSFYAGDWERNIKDGIGLMKVTNDIFFFGRFEFNQFKNGILFYNSKKYVFYGDFNNGFMERGIYLKYLENEKKVLYRGAWTKEKKKEGNQCVYHEIDNGNFFFGDFVNDKPVKGLLVVYKTPNEVIKEQVIEFEKIFYFDIKENDIKYTIQSSFGDEQQDKAAQIAGLFLQKDYDFIENISLIFDEINQKIEKFENNENYKNIEGKYINICDKIYKSLQKKYEKIFNVCLRDLDGENGQGFNDEDFKEEDFLKEGSTPFRTRSIKFNKSSSFNSQNSDFKYVSSK